MSVQANLAWIRQQIPPERAIRLVAVTKYCTPAQMQEAYEAGIRDFGENRIQDLQRKQQQLAPDVVQAVSWHLLGHLQTNKVNKTLTLPKRLALIQSVDSLRLAQRISQAHQAAGTCQAVLLQVNVTQEPQKTGFSEEQLWMDFPAIQILPGIAVRGLMAMGPNPPEPEAAHACFQHVYELRNRLATTFSCPLDELSMGMSQDFHHAIECGATIMRIGNRLFAPGRVDDAASATTSQSGYAG